MAQWRSRQRNSAICCVAELSRFLLLACPFTQFHIVIETCNVLQPFEPTKFES